MATVKQYQGGTAPLVEDQEDGTHVPLVKLLGELLAQYTEDAPHTSGDKGVLLLAIRSDNDAPTADDGDYTTLKLDEAGRLKVASQPASYPLITVPVTAVNGVAVCQVGRASNIMVSMAATGLSGHSAVFEGSIDSTDGSNGTWFGLQAVRSNANTIEAGTGVLTATPAYAWELSVNGCNWFRVRCTGHTAGTAAYSIQRGTYATEPIPAAQTSATQAVSLTTGQGAESAAAAGNAVRVGGRVRTAADTTLTANDAADHTMTSAGQVLVRNGGLTETFWNYSAPLTTTTPAAMAAGAAGLKRHITGLQAINTGASTVELILLDGTTDRWRMPLPPNVPMDFSFGDTHLIVSVGAALNVNLSAAGTVRVNAQGYTSL